MSDNVIDRARAWNKKQVEKNPKTNITIINTRFGTGKTYAMCKHFSHYRNVCLFAPEHLHISGEFSRMLADFGVPDEEILHHMGFEKACMLNSTLDETIIKENMERINKIQTYIKMKIPPRFFVLHVCKKCPFKKSHLCQYQRQTSSKIIKKSVNLKPYELMNSASTFKYDMIGCDEGIDKWREFNYGITPDRIEELYNISNYDIAGYNMQAKTKLAIDTDNFTGNLRALKRFLSYVHKKIVMASVIKDVKQCDIKKKILNNKNPDYMISEIFDKGDHYHLISHVDTLFTIENEKNIYSDFYDLFHIGQHSTQFMNQLRYLLIYATRKMNDVMIHNILMILNLVENMNLIFMPVIVNERVTLNDKGIYISNIGKVYGSNWKNKQDSYFVGHTHQLFDLFRLSTKNKIRWVVATFDERKFKLILDKYRRLKEIDDSCSFDKSPEIIYEIKDFDDDKQKFPPYTLCFYDVRRERGGSFSRYSLSLKDKRGQNTGISILQNYIIPFIKQDTKDTALMTFKDYYEIIRGQLGAEFCENNFRHFGAEKGSNFVVGRKKFICFGTLYPPVEEYILEYIRLFDEVPPLELVHNDARNFINKTTIPDNQRKNEQGSFGLIGFMDEKLQYIFKTLVEDRIVDDIHRQRDIYNPKSKIYVMGIIPRYIQDKYKVQRLYLSELLITEENIRRYKKHILSGKLFTMKTMQTTDVFFFKIISQKYVCKGLDVTYDQKHHGYRLKKCVRKDRKMLREKIINNIPEGEVISLKILRKRLKVSSNILQTVVNELEDEGIISKIKGRGGGIKMIKTLKTDM